MAKVIGLKKYTDRLARLASPVKNKDILAALYSVGQSIEIDAEISITAGSVSGKDHLPSLPGQPPNADTRHLDTNIETRIEKKYPPTVVVESKASYSAALEFGTTKMTERPFMRPAVKKNRKNVVKGVAAVVRRKT